jgi:sugar lactone lactonase YvrE
MIRDVLTAKLFAGRVAAMVMLCVAVAWSTCGLKAGELAIGEVQYIPIGLIDAARRDTPEGIAIDASNGSLYVGNRYITGEGADAVLVSEILRRNPDGRVSVFATLPPAHPESQGVLGLTTDAGGDVYAAFASFDPATSGIYRVRGGGRKVGRLPGSENMIFPNALSFDNSGNLFATDSIGAIWRFNPEERKSSGVQWAFDESLQPFNGPITIPGLGIELELPGANGIAFAGSNQQYVANTEKGLLVRVPIQADGTAGPAEVVAGDVENAFSPIFSIDGIAADAEGNVHAAIPAFGILLGVLGIPSSPVVKIDPGIGGTSGIEPIVTDLGVAFGSFDVPLSLAFGTLQGDKESVFVTNGALFPDLFPGPGPGVVQVGVGVPGFSGAGDRLHYGGARRAVPEPASALLAVVTFATCRTHRRRRISSQG